MRGVKPTQQIPRDTRVPHRIAEDGSIHPEHHSIFDTRTAAMQGENGWMGEPLQRGSPEPSLRKRRRASR